MFPTATRILLADDHKMFRQALSNLLSQEKDLEIVAEADNGETMVTMARRWQPDIILADIGMPVMSGIEATRIIKMESPQIHIIALSMMQEMSMINEMLEAGALGYLSKNAGREELCKGIYAAREHRQYFCLETTQTIAAAKKKAIVPQTNQQISKREQEVLLLLCKGHSSREIAALLNVSVHTIRGHRESLRKKTDNKNAAGLMLYAIKKGWLQDLEDGMGK